MKFSHISWIFTKINSATHYNAFKIIYLSWNPYLKLLHMSWNFYRIICMEHFNICILKLIKKLLSRELIEPLKSNYVFPVIYGVKYSRKFRAGVFKTPENGYWVSRATSHTLQCFEGEGGNYVVAYSCWLQVLIVI